MNTTASSIPTNINMLAQSSGISNIGDPSDYDESILIQGYIPDHVTPGSWQPWNSTTPCPAGYTCAELGEKSLGAYSCDEMARIAVEEFGFGNVLAGTWCPEGNTSVLNCQVGGYCPDTVSKEDFVAPFLDSLFLMHISHSKTISYTLQHNMRLQTGNTHRVPRWHVLPIQNI
jgi:hypothetical protein